VGQVAAPGSRRGIAQAQINAYYHLGPGDGLFGVEAASQTYFHKSAKALNAREAALLATALPNPIKRNPASPRLFQRRLAENLMARAAGSSEWLGCLRK